MPDLPDVPPHAPNVHPIPADGRRSVGQLESILHRRWPHGTVPPQQTLTAIDSLAGLPSHLAGRLAEFLTGIYIGLGVVTDYEVFADLAGQPVDTARPQGGSWSDIPAAYRDRAIVIGSGGEPLTFDLCVHELAHAFDDLDGMISDGPDFRTLHFTCIQDLTDDRYLKRVEFFAEMFCLVYHRAWDVMERLLHGNSDRVYSVRAWYMRNYAIGR
jgi:hypothetical protein